MSILNCILTIPHGNEHSYAELLSHGTDLHHSVLSVSQRSNFHAFPPRLYLKIDLPTEQIINIMVNRPGTCATCGVSVPAARLITCQQCKEGRDVDGSRSTINYCSHRCLVSDHTHPSQCLARNIRKRLYRAGSILQPVFYAWRRASWHREFDQVDYIDGTLYISRFSRSVRKEKKIAVYPGPFTMFPREIAGNDQQQKVILSYMGCNDATQMSYQLVKSMLGGK